LLETNREQQGIIRRGGRGDGGEEGTCIVDFIDAKPWAEGTVTIPQHTIVFLY
jgi:hypothetical protein